MADEEINDPEEAGFVEGQDDPKGFKRVLFKIRHIVGKALKFAILGAVIGGLGLAAAGIWATVTLGAGALTMGGGVLGGLATLAAPILAGLAAMFSPVVAGVAALAGAVGITAGAGVGTYMLGSLAGMAGSALAGLLVTGAAVGAAAGGLIGGTVATSNAQDAANDEAMDIRGRMETLAQRQERNRAMKARLDQQKIESAKQQQALGITPELNLSGLPFLASKTPNLGRSA